MFFLLTLAALLRPLAFKLPAGDGGQLTYLLRLAWRSGRWSHFLAPVLLVISDVHKFDLRKFVLPLHPILSITFRDSPICLDACKQQSLDSGQP